MTQSQKTLWYAVLFAVGVVLVVLCILEYLGPYWSGLGGTLAGVAGIRLIQAWRYHHDPAYAKKLDTADTDERNVFVANKAADLTFRVSVLVLAVLSVVLRALGHTNTASTLAIVVGAQTLGYFVSYLALSRKY